MDAGNGPQQGPRLGLNVLAVNHVAGVVHGHGLWQGLQLRCECCGEAAIGEKFLHVQHWCTELHVSLQQFVVGLHRVAATGRCHQHGIEIPVHAVHAAHKIRGQLAGQLQFPLVMTHGTAASLIRRNHHLEPIGLQNFHRGDADGRIEATLHAAQQ